MFKNLILYAIGSEVPHGPAALEAAMAPGAFVPCGKTQPSSSGWVPPRGVAHGALVESVGGHWLLKMMTETKLLPNEVVKRRVDEMAAQILADTGRKPGKRQRRELADEAVLELLPVAFTRRTTTMAWIDPGAKLLMIDAASQARADLVAAALVQCWPKMNLHLLRVQDYVDAAMARWMLTHNPPHRFSIDRDAVLESADEDHAVVRYQHYGLDAPDVRHHLKSGKVPTKLAMTYDARVSFVLVDDLRIQRIEIADMVLMEQKAQAGDEFDGDVAIATGELAALIANLVEELGGQAVLPIEAAAADGGGEDPAPAPRGDTEAGAESDPLYMEACTLVRTKQRASISLIQRELHIGYNRAARLLERMEDDGLVSAMGSDGKRTVLAVDDVLEVA
jgi:recombination associated protein RdgC